MVSVGPPAPGRGKSTERRAARGRACPPRAVRSRLRLGSLGLALLLGGGCTPLMEFVHNGFKVGPNYQRPPAPLAPAWIDSGNPRVKSAPADYSAWWAAFNDPMLNDLVRTA
jgi:hypothetical protein